jgi:hypothetical protein
MQQFQQCALIDRELLQRLALDARHDAGNEPVREAHLDDDDQRAVRFEGSEASAQVIGGGLNFGRLPDTDRDLCSQPTLSRLENAPRLRKAIRLSYALVGRAGREMARPAGRPDIDGS